MQVDIISPEKKLYSGQADAIQFPGIQGRFQVLENHADLISTLTSGEIVMEVKGQQPQIFPINGGVVEVRDNKVSVLAD